MRAKVVISAVALGVAAASVVMPTAPAAAAVPICHWVTESDNGSSFTGFVWAGPSTGNIGCEFSINSVCGTAALWVGGSPVIPPTQLTFSDDLVSMASYVNGAYQGCQIIH
jgi:hypothetical protein